MADPSFNSWITGLGAQPSDVLDTPFMLYKKGSTLFHFIDFSTYREQQVSGTFLKSCFALAAHKGYKIITIWEDVWHNKRALVCSRLAVMSGTRRRIHARQTTVIRLDKETAHSFLSINHLQGATSAYYKFGLQLNNELVAVATFSKARTMYDGPVYYRSFELERFAAAQGLTVTGGLGKLLRHFITQYEPPHLMTYADADWGNGHGYLKNGFTLVAHTDPQQFVIDPEHLTRTYLHHMTNRAEKDALIVANSGSLKFVLNRQK